MAYGPFLSRPPLIFNQLYLSRAGLILSTFAMNSVQRLSSLARAVGARQMSGKPAISPDFAKFKARQEFFQSDSHLLVHEKTTTDRVLFGATTFMTIVAMGMTFKFFYDFSFPKKA